MNMKLGLTGLTAMVLAACGEPAQFYPVVRTAIPGGYTLSAVQQPASKGACVLANERYAAPIKKDCADCKIEYTGCDSALSGAEKALAAGQPVAQYSVTSGTLHVLIGGAEAVAKAVCEQMAAEVAKKGANKAVCEPPAKP